MNSIGRTNWNCAPLLPSDDAVSLPPWCSIIMQQIANPNPVPCAFVVSLPGSTPPSSIRVSQLALALPEGRRGPSGPGSLFSRRPNCRLALTWIVTVGPRDAMEVPVDRHSGRWHQRQQMRPGLKRAGAILGRPWKGRRGRYRPIRRSAVGLTGELVGPTLLGFLLMRRRFGGFGRGSG